MSRETPGPSGPALNAMGEEVFVASGPSVLSFLLQSVGNRSEAVRILGVGPATLSRWLSSEVGDLFGPRKDLRTWRSVWFGYPSPLPGFDRVVESVLGRGNSWLSVRTFQVGLEEALALARSNGLLLGDAVPAESIGPACRRLSVPNTTQWRWARAVPWPYQWLVLDRLAREVAGRGWPELVLSYRSDAAPMKVPMPGLVRVLDESVPVLRTRARRLPR